MALSSIISTAADIALRFFSFFLLVLYSALKVSLSRISCRIPKYIDQSFQSNVPPKELRGGSPCAVIETGPNRSGRIMNIDSCLLGVASKGEHLGGSIVSHRIKGSPGSRPTNFVYGAKHGIGAATGKRRHLDKMAYTTRFGKIDKN